MYEQLIFLSLLFLFLFLASNKAGQANSKDLKEKNVNSSSSSDEANRNLTIMLIALAFNYIIGNTPYMIYYSMLQVGYKIPLWFFLLSLTCLYLLRTFKLFIHYFFNKLFRQQLNAYLKYLKFLRYRN